MTVEDLIAVLSEFPGHHEVMLNVTGSRLLVGEVTARSDIDGPWVEVRPAKR
jgi:hypothetical protein